MSESTSAEPATTKTPWYSGVTRYQWLVLAIASAGWIFDVFEGQLFGVYKTPAMADVLGVEPGDSSIDRYANYSFAAFLVGGALGGLVFGVLADRFGRRSTMIVSILVYSVFTGLHYFATTWWHIAILRFFVAMGVGGEWAIAASLVAEVFPKKARAVASGIFHASSVLGVVFAAICKLVLDVTQWRVAFLIGLLPALLVLWIRSSVRESDRWEKSGSEGAGGGRPRGDLRELIADRRLLMRAILGLILASIGLASYWATVPWSLELVGEVLGDTATAVEKKNAASWAFIIMNVTGALAGLLLFAPISTKIGRRKAFAFYHVGALVLVPATFLIPASHFVTVALLCVMAFFVVGMHAGYAIYFPELFPTRLRATGASFCFNLGRLISAALLLVRGELREALGMRYAVSAMAILFAVGLIVLWFAPETRDAELED